jgi:large subunit ribosomal protein L23Ae
MAAKAKPDAKKTGKALKKGLHQRKHKKWTTVRFRRPETKVLPRKPKYAGKTRLDKFSTFLQPLATEKALKIIETFNTLVFLVDPKSNKKQIKEFAEKLYNIKVTKVNTLIRPDGKKKAFIKISPEYEGVDIANKIGII